MHMCVCAYACVHSTRKCLTLLSFRLSCFKAVALPKSDAEKEDTSFEDLGVRSHGVGDGSGKRWASRQLSLIHQ